MAFRGDFNQERALDSAPGEHQGSHLGPRPGRREVSSSKELHPDGPSSLPAVTSPDHLLRDLWTVESSAWMPAPAWATPLGLLAANLGPQGCRSPLLGRKEHQLAQETFSPDPEEAAGVTGEGGTLRKYVPESTDCATGTRACVKARWKEGPKVTRLPAAGKDSQGTESPAPSALRPSSPPGRAGGQGEGAEASPSCRKVWLNRPRRPSTTRTDKLVHQFLPLFLEKSRSPNFDNCDAQDRM